MSWTIIQQSLPEFAKGFRLTLWLSLVGILGAMVVGIIVSLVRYFKVPYLAGILGAYVELARNTPLLIQLFFLYYAFPGSGNEQLAAGPLRSLSAGICAFGTGFGCQRDLFD